MSHLDAAGSSPVPAQPSDFDQFDETDRPLRLAYVGRIKEIKGLPYFLDTITEMNKLDSHI